MSIPAHTNNMDHYHISLMKDMDSSMNSSVDSSMNSSVDSYVKSSMDSSIIDEYYDIKWYQILDRLAASWATNKTKKKTLELNYKLGLFRSDKGINEYAPLLREKYEIAGL